MEASSLCMLVYLLITMFCLGGTGTRMNLVLSVHAIESPQYTVVRSESEFEIRVYKESLWMSALVQGTSFVNSTKDGFHRLYQYIHGANLNSSHMAITAPVLTSIPRATPAGHDSSVRIYLSAKFQGNPPQPSPELNLQLDKWKTHCVAIRKFSGFARDDNIHKEIEALISSLNKHLTGKSAIAVDKSSSTIAQYNALFRRSGQLNEVWINVTGFTADGCPPS